MDTSPEMTALIAEIKNDRVHGASELARQAAKILKIAAQHSASGTSEQLWLALKMVGERLMAVRPSMAPLANITSRLLNAFSGKYQEMELGALRSFIASKVDEAIADSLQAVGRIAEHSVAVIRAGDRIMTHSYSSTVVAALKRAFDSYGEIETIVTRSGAGRTGERIARELGLYGIPVTFIDDTASGLYIKSVGKVFVGADRVCADGTVVNGIGTSPLALLAKKAGVPFYVLCETLKFDPRLRGDEVELEEGASGEIIDQGKLATGVMVRNPYFDITPPELVTGIITEMRRLTTDEATRYMKEHLLKSD